MELKWFEDVLILLEEKSLTRAAQRRNITQPAFSRRIRAFEHWLGTEILDRKANTVEVNASLLANEDEIKALVHRTHELRSRMKNFVPERKNVTVTMQHALIFSAFPDIANLTRAHMSGVSFRLRAGNRAECISVLLRGDASILLCYEDDTVYALPFDETIVRAEWGLDRLVLVGGGSLRYLATPSGGLPESTPAIVYPENSHFGEILSHHNKPFSTREGTLNPACETAFSAGIKEMALSGIGVAWLPMSMVYKEIENGKLAQFSNAHPSVPLKITFYTNFSDSTAAELHEIWQQRRN